VAAAIRGVERPLMESLTALSERFLGGLVRGGHEPVQGHADTEDHVAHGDLQTRLSMCLFMRPWEPRSCRDPSTGERTLPGTDRSGGP